MIGIVVLFASAVGDAETPKSLEAPKSAVDFRLVLPGEPGACKACRAFTYEGILGEIETAFARDEPDLTLKPDRLLGLTAWKVPYGFHIAVITTKQGAEILGAFAGSVRASDTILVSVGDQQLGTFSSSLLVASNGTLGFGFEDERYFVQALEALGLDESVVTESSDDDLLRACAEIVDPSSRERCQRLTWTQLERNKDSLCRAEKLLESGDAKDRDAAIEELLKD